MTKCPPDCTCKRHQHKVRSKCEPGCTCARHGRQITDEHRQNIAKANAARKGQPQGKCPSGCTCNKHRAYYRGGSKQGRTFSEQAKKNIAEAAKRKWERIPAPERTEMVREWVKSYGNPKVSKKEYTLAPYLAKLGYRHNDDRALVVGRKFPDFFDEQNRRVFEFFGNYWHPDPAEEQKVIDFYATQGWECTVLWEADLYEWLREHEHLCSDMSAP